MIWVISQPQSGKEGGHVITDLEPVPHVHVVECLEAYDVHHPVGGSNAVEY